MIFTDTEHYLNELELTVANTEPLYKEALAIKDMSRSGDELNALYGKTANQIKANGGVLPNFATDHDFMDVMDQFQSIVSRVRSE